MKDFNTIGSWVDGLPEGIPEGLLADLEISWKVDQIVSGWIPSSEDFEPKYDMAPRHTRNCPLTAAFCKPSSSFGCVTDSSIN